MEPMDSPQAASDTESAGTGAGGWVTHREMTHEDRAQRAAQPANQGAVHARDGTRHELSAAGAAGRRTMGLLMTLTRAWAASALATASAVSAPVHRM